MTYVALLRGINVGGNAKVDMKTLKIVFEKCGLNNVKTYINSGNILFQDTNHSVAEMEKKLETAIEKEFGFVVKVLLRTAPQIHAVIQGLPKTWTNDTEQKCDVIFLWEEINSKNVLKLLPPAAEFETLRYVPGAVLWRIDRNMITKSKLLRIVGTKIYKQMTIRNCNTVRKLDTMIEEMEKEEIEEVI